jgi:hypothetical protein
MDVSLFIMNRHYRMATAGVYAEPAPYGSETSFAVAASHPYSRNPSVESTGSVDKLAEKSANTGKVGRVNTRALKANSVRKQIFSRRAQLAHPGCRRGVVAGGAIMENGETRPASRPAVSPGHAPLI